jgi:hypothetical protein
MSNIIEIGSAKVSKIYHKDCQHKQLLYDPQERTIECADCKRFIDPFSAFMTIVHQIGREREKLDEKRQEILDLREKGLTLIAAKKVEKAWRRRDMVPACPHCEAGILPTDGLGDSMVNKKMDAERKAFKKRQKDGGNV